MEKSDYNLRKVIAAINMSIDGFCDHTSGLPNEEIHQHYAELLGQGDAILYGRIYFMSGLSVFLS